MLASNEAVSQPAQAVSSEQLIEFEQSLIAQSNIPNIANPCLRRTMLVGPKKMIGNNPNPQLHQHSNKKVAYTDFDTFSMLY